jgi:hypothetical protein
VRLFSLHAKLAKDAKQEAAKKIGLRLNSSSSAERLQPLVDMGNPFLLTQNAFLAKPLPIRAAVACFVLANTQGGEL